MFTFSLHFVSENQNEIGEIYSRPNWSALVGTCLEQRHLRINRSGVSDFTPPRCFLGIKKLNRTMGLWPSTAPHAGCRSPLTCHPPPPRTPRCTAMAKTKNLAFVAKTLVNLVYKNNLLRKKQHQTQHQSGILVTRLQIKSSWEWNRKPG